MTPADSGVDCPVRRPIGGPPGGVARGPRRLLLPDPPGAGDGTDTAPNWPWRNSRGPIGASPGFSFCTFFRKSYYDLPEEFTDRPPSEKRTILARYSAFPTRL